MRTGDSRVRCVTQKRPRRSSDTVSDPHPSPARRAAPLRGGEEGAVALASASRSSPAHAPALCARAHSPSRPPPLPRLPLSRAPAATTTVPESPATSPKQPAAPARSSRNGSSSATDPEVLLLPTARQLGCELGSDFLAPAAAGWKAKAFKHLEPLSFGRE